MEEQEARELMRHFDSSRSEESRHEGAPSVADVIATEYMRRVNEGKKKCAQEDHGLAFEG